MTEPDASRAPKRVQMTRQKPWRADHPDAVIVDRRTKWGNPFPLYTLVCATTADGSKRYEIPKTRGQAADLFRRWLTGPSPDAAPVLDALPELRGRDLACWCPLDQPCHADVLLELAND